MKHDGVVYVQNQTCCSVQRTIGNTYLNYIPIKIQSNLSQRLINIRITSDNLSGSVSMDTEPDLPGIS